VTYLAGGWERRKEFWYGEVGFVVKGRMGLR
jgi:hypothetical protein